MGWPGVVVLMAIESACIPFPSEIIMPLAGWMLVRAHGGGLEGVLLMGLWGAVGNALGSAVAYGVGAWGGRPFLDRYGRYLFISHHDIATADRWFARYGNWAVFGSRLLPVVRTFISLPAGIARMPFAMFLGLSFLGSYPWSVALAYGGYLLGEHWEQLRSLMRPFDYPIIAVILLLTGWYVYRHIRRFNAA